MTVVDLLARQSAGRDLIRERTRAAILAAWDGLGSYRDADVEAFLVRVLPVIRAGQLTTAQITTAYIAAVVAEQLDEPMAPVPFSPSDVTALRPVDEEAVYTRPFVTVRGALANGAALTPAVALGRDRLRRLVDDDLSLAHRRSVLMAIDSTDSVTGYRRVIRPELSSGGTCGLCIAAASQVYRRGDLMPVHSSCSCGVLPVVRTAGGALRDPGRDVNGQDIDDLYRSLGATRAAELKKVRYSVHDHGELGPSLAPQGQHFATRSDLTA